MRKLDAIDLLTSEHWEFNKYINSLSSKQMTEELVYGSWTVKDIIAHITAWDVIGVVEIKGVLKDEFPENVGPREDSFNKREVEKRKMRSLEEVLKEREEAFGVMIKVIKKLSEEEWQYDSGYKWEDGTSVTVTSLFNYRYESAGHEGGHLKQIKKYFKGKL